MNQGLTESDARELETNPSDHTKMKIIEKLALNFLSDEMNIEERAIAQDILRFLADDISALIRETISERFASSEYLPHDVAIRLAHDLEDPVAMPVISRSRVLEEQDLITLIEESSPKRQGAIAERANLTPNVVAHLAYSASSEAVERLVKNYKVQIPENVADAIISTYGNNEHMMRSMILHKRVDLTQAHDLLIKVSEDLRKLIIVEYNIPSTTVNNLVHESKEWLLLSMIRNHADDMPNSPSLGQIINKLEKDGELTFSILIKGLSVGNLVFFEVALSHISKLPFDNVRKLLWEAGDGSGYAAVHEKCGFPESMKEAMWQLIKIVHDERISNTPENVTQRIHHRLIKTSQASDIRNIDYLLTIVAHNIRKLRK